MPSRKFVVSARIALTLLIMIGTSNMAFSQFGPPAPSYELKKGPVTNPQTPTQQGGVNTGSRNIPNYRAPPTIEQLGFLVATLQDQVNTLQQQVTKLQQNTVVLQLYIQTLQENALTTNGPPGRNCGPFSLISPNDIIIRTKDSIVPAGNGIAPNYYPSGTQIPAWGNCGP